MKRTTLGLLVLSGALLTPLSSFAHDVSCTRGGLRNAVEHYIEAQSSGDLSGMALPANVGYWENMQPADINSSIVTKPLKIDHHMSIYDDAAEPYVIGTRLRVNHDKIAEVETLWTTTGYWLFNADNYLKYSSEEDWGPLPVSMRSSRGTLVKAANAYLDAFLEGKIDDVPWGFPCVRVEGGLYTGKGSPDDSCEVGVPAGVNISNRRFVVDEVTGSVVVFCTFGTGGSGGGSSAPDTHLFRVENGKLRYVHTLTHMLQSSFRGGNN